VEDPDQDDDQLSWIVEGYLELQVVLDERILTVAVPDSEWYGTEILYLTVKDPMNLQDTASVAYSVIPVNDPPAFAGLPDYEIDEDDTLHIDLGFLFSLVTDVDDDSGTHRFYISNESFQGVTDTGSDRFHLIPESDWYGNEQVIFFAEDTSGAAASDTSLVTVNSVLDPPGNFQLISPLNGVYTQWPDSIEFCWESSEDPDPGDLVFYIWTLDGQGGAGGLETRTATLYGDTTYVFYPDTLLPDGIYFWWVEARDTADSTRQSVNNGVLRVGDTGVEQKEQALPSSFYLFQNFPNPFNPRTLIRYQVPQSVHVKLAVIDPLGRQVRVLKDRIQSPGVHTVEWDSRDSEGRKLSSGVYLIYMRAGNRVFYRKMLLIQ
jgi:hypothetical protein